MKSSGPHATGSGIYLALQLVTKKTGLTGSSGNYHPKCSTTSSYNLRPRVDTSAEVLFLFVFRHQNLPSQSLTLAAANLGWGLQWTFCWRFIIADIDIPILYADFLCHEGLLANLHNGSLIDHKTSLRLSGRISSCSCTSLSLVSDDVFDACIRALL